MLVLRRKAGEAIVLNGVITIHVLAVEGERVKLGISAPPEVVIVRSELLENAGGTGAAIAPGSSMAGPAPMPRERPRPYREADAGPDEGGEGGAPRGARGSGPQTGYSRFGRHALNDGTQPEPIGTPPPPVRYRG
jgi:carbon storage regulator